MCNTFRTFALFIVSPRIPTLFSKDWKSIGMHLGSSYFFKIFGKSAFLLFHGGGDGGSGGGGSGGRAEADPAWSKKARKTNCFLNFR